MNRKALFCAIVLSVVGTMNLGCMPKMTIAEMKAQMPKRPAELDRLNRFVGKWTGEGTPGFLLRKVDPRGPHYQANAGLFRDLPPGKYELRVANQDRDIPVRVVTIPDTTELTLP